MPPVIPTFSSRSFGIKASLDGFDAVRSIAGAGVGADWPDRAALPRELRRPEFGFVLGVVM